MRMPSASAKLEKQASIEALEPMKQIVTMVEKKVRNLEKRKAKLDSYKNDSQNGKELNDDQKKAVEKYDTVVEVLEFAKEMQKSFCNVIQETSKAQKKVAKREHLERQQHELQRIKEIIMIQDILNSMDGETVRNDFLNGNNGAVKLAEEELSSLDELYKLICPERDPEAEDNSEYRKQLIAAAEHLQLLLDSKNKEVIGTTYKSLKDTINKIHSCSYFNKSAETVPCSTELEGSSEPAAVETKESSANSFNEEETQQFTFLQVEDVKPSNDNASIQQSHADHSFYQSESVATHQDQNRPLQEVLPVQGNLNFLQESQIDLEAAILDQPVAPHSVPAGAGVGYPANYVSVAQTTVTQGMVSPRFQQRPKEETALSSHHPSPQVIPDMVSTATVQQQGARSLQAQNSSTTPADFDPNQPIPTQTYTNQSFSVHPMMAPVNVDINGKTYRCPGYVPAPLAHAMPPQHLLPTNIISQPVQPRATPTSSPGVLDPNVLPASVHSQPSGLSVSSAASKLSMVTHDSKEHFTREFHVPVSRENTLLGHPTAVACNTQYERVNAHEGYQATSNSQTFLGHDNFTAESSTYSSNLKRGLQARGVARGNGSRGASNVPRGNRGAYRT